MNTQPTRREFLSRSASTGTALAGLAAGLNWARDGWLDVAQSAEPARETTPVPIVDTHQHLWDLSRFRLAWQQKDGLEPLRRDFLMPDYLEATRGLHVVKTVYMEVNVDPAQQTQEAKHVIALCERDDNPMAAAVIGGSPQTQGFADDIRPLAKSPYVKGVRTVLHDPDRPPGLCLRPQFVDSMKLLGDLGLSFDLCMRPDEIIDGVKLARQCPGTRFIVDHCGNMSVTSDDRALRQRWMDGIHAAAEQENMVCKISGIVVTADPEWQPSDLAPNMNFCMEAFGDDRVFFGGDWPVCTLKATFAQWVDALKWIVRDRTPEFQRKLFHDNAVRFYGLA